MTLRVITWNYVTQLCCRSFCTANISLGVSPLKVQRWALWASFLYRWVLKRWTTPPWVPSERQGRRQASLVMRREKEDREGGRGGGVEYDIPTRLWPLFALQFCDQDSLVVFSGCLRTLKEDTGRGSLWCKYILAHHWQPLSQYQNHHHHHYWKQSRVRHPLHHPPDHQVCRETGAGGGVGGERSTEEMVPHKVERILKKSVVLYFRGSIDDTPTVLHMD